MAALAALWGKIRTRRGALIAVPVALVLLIALVAVPIAVSQQCRLFGTGCKPPHIRFRQFPRALTPVEAATRGGYVALGDSYSSGEGAWNAAADSAYVAGGAADCHRSGHSYFPLVMRAYRFAAGGGLYACSGARIPNVLQRGEHGEPPQITHVGPRTSLVTLSIGGNDIGFSQIVAKCVVRLPWSSACRDQDPQIRARLAQLPAGLGQVLDQITRRAPKARVVVLGYPRPFPVRPTHPVSNIGTADQSYLNTVAQSLDQVLYTAAREADRRLAAARRPGSVEFVDAYRAFDGHELGTAQPYLNALDIDWSQLAAAPRSFHPNAQGYQRFAELMNQQIKAGPGRQIFQWR